MKLVVFIIFLTIPLGLEAQEETISLDPFGEIHVYQPANKSPVSVLILISGDGGWEHAVLKMAKVLSGEGCLVAGVDINQYLKNLAKASGDCASPATDFLTLGQSIQEKYGIKKQAHPYLVGYSSGATLVYVAIVQAPPSIFSAAFSFGFCPDFSVKKPFCKGKYLEWDEGPKKTSILFRPTKNLQIPWIVFQGYVDQVCNENVTRSFVQQIPNAEFVLLPKVGHGFNVLKNWLPKFQEIFNTIEKQ